MLSPPSSLRERLKRNSGVAPKCVRVCVTARARASGCPQGQRRRRGPFKEPEGAGRGGLVRAGSRERGG